MSQKKTSYFITGGCGFIASHLVARLSGRGRIVIYDNLSSGKKEFIEPYLQKGEVEFIEADLLDLPQLKKAVGGAEMVFHLAANPDIRRGIDAPEVDFNQGIVATYNLLEAMRAAGVKRIVFSSSSTVYGEPALRPTPEGYGTLEPISVYGAAKLACEGLISAYCHMFGMRGWIFRFANIVGKNATHGILVDFFAKLAKDPDCLEVLGDGRQRKSYLLAEECVEAMLYAVEKAEDRSLNIFNLGTQDDIEISRIAAMVVEKLQLKGVRFKYTGTRSGWPGDVPLMLLDTTKIKKIGWQPKYNSQQSLEKAIGSLIEAAKLR